MSSARSAAPSGVYSATPTVLDFSLLFVGMMLSVFVLRLGAVHLRLNVPLDGSARAVVPWLKPLLALPQGVALLWPLFFGMQRLFGRKERLTSGEWLWAFSCAGATALTGLALWKEWGTLPELLRTHYDTPRQLWYELLTPCLAGLALLVAILDGVKRTARPWTHSLGLALILWPALPLVVALAL